MQNLKLKWEDAPISISFGADMMEALIEINKDETARIFAQKDAIPELEQALEKYFLEKNSEK
jgi:hypothetical protein